MAQYSQEQAVVRARASLEPQRVQARSANRRAGARTTTLLGSTSLASPEMFRFE